VNKWSRLAAGAALSIVGAVTQAAIHCEGLVTYAFLYADGNLNVLGAWRGDYTVLCNVNGTRNGISPEICLSWYASAAKAAADAKIFAVYYDTTTHTCANLPVYTSAPAVVYAGIKRQ
jgi:hypothetical protein